MMNGNEVGSWTDNQRKFLFSQLEKNNVSKEELEANLGFPMSDLTKIEASGLIDCLTKNGDLSETVNKIKELHGNAQKSEDKVEQRQVPAEAPQQIIQKKVENPMKVEKPSSRPQLMAKFNGIPEELADMYFAIIDGALYIKNPGLLYMASKKGYAKIETISESDEKGGFVAVAKIYPHIPIEFIKAITPLSPEIQTRLLNEQYGPTTEKGSANKENVKNSRMFPFFEELARTRAVDRALRLYTGYGGTAYEELPNSEIERD